MTGMVKRFIALSALAVGVPLVAAGPASAAYPVTPFPTAYLRGGATGGGVIWYARSVGIQGWVEDYASEAGSSTVAYNFYQGDTYLGQATRTATSRKIPINFTQEGPQGGIIYVQVVMCTPVECGPVADVVRPGS
jgi:hypothetical protein